MYEIEKYVPFSTDDIYFDYQIIAEDKEDKQLRVLLAVVKKSDLDVFIDITSQLGAGISGIEIHPTALANYFFWDRRHLNGDAYAVIYLKDNNLEVSFIKDNMLGYSRFMRLQQGQNDLHGLILKELNPLKEGLGPDSGGLDISFCGSDADFESIRTIGDEAGFEVHQVYYSSSGIPSHDLVSAYGAALKGIQKMPMDINILPLGLRKKASRVSYYTMFVLALLLVLSIAGWGGGGILRQRLTLNRVNAEMEHLGPEILSIKQIQKKYKQIEEKVDYLGSFRGSNGTPINVLKDLTRIIPESASLSKFNYSEKGIEIEGSAGSASELIPLLEASPLFKDVAFLSAITKRGSKEKFRIGLKLK
ncbi:MAG: hypothetical protein GY864_01855 [Desulfobacterales bacterium]|nr:hypothetical protein [Desulfobacterales bacterium]